MSYILEALKMSEQARRLDAAETPVSLLPPVTAEESESDRSWRLHLPAGALMLLNVVAIGIWLRPAGPDPAPVVPAPKEMPATAQTTAALAPGADIPSAPASPPPPTQSQHVGSAPPSVDPPRVAAGALLVPDTPIPESGAGNGAARNAPLPPIAKSEPPTLPNPMDAMAASVQKQLPPITVTGFIQDAEQNNLVIVNDRLLREGEEAAPGLKLEKILSDGVVFSFKGYRFKR
jgi:general secretion pathway protein B